MDLLTALVRRAHAGDLEAFGRLVQATQAMAYGAARSVLRDPSLAQDAVQQAYVRAWRRLGDLQEPQAFAGWLRRIVLSVSLNLRRARRSTLLCLDDVPDVPVLDAEETSWSEGQRRRLAAALLTLTPDERQLCDRRYHGQWTTARLAADVGVDGATLRKRLQRIRDKLRKEIEMREQRAIAAEELRADLPDKVVELLARPRLIDLPEKLEDEGRWFEVMAWGLFTDRIVRLVGGDPATHTLGGVGYGLERLAMLRYGIDDIRKVEVASVV